MEMNLKNGLDLGNLIPSGLGSKIGSGLIFFFIAMGVMILVAGVIAWWYYSKQYNQKINVWKKVGGITQKTATYKGTFIKIGQAGDRVLFVKEPKKYLPTPRIQAGPNEWNFFIGEDGEWINFEWTDIDTKKREMGVHFVDYDMRMARLATEKAMANLLKQKKWWQEYAPYIALGILIILLCIGMAIVFHEWKGVFSESQKAFQGAKEVAEAVNNLAKQQGTTPLHTIPPEGG